MSETKNLKLKKHDNPETNTEKFDIENYLNGNWDKIDKNTEEINKKIENIQALPVGGTKGQVLTKQSETEGDANWEDIEANEVFVGNEEEAPETAKIIVEDEDFEEDSTLGKAEVYVGAEEPTTGEKVWFNKNKNSIYVRNSNGVYEEFAKKSEEAYSTEEVKIGTWIDGKPLYKKVLKINNIRIDNSTIIITNILNMDTLINAEGLFINGSNGIYSPYPIYSGTNFLQMYISQDGTKIGFTGNDSWSANINRTHLFILEYTKTTD